MCLAGRRPFQADSVPAVTAAIIADAPAPLSAFRPDIPPAIDALLARCLEKDPARRIQTVTELARGLAPFGSIRGTQSFESIARLLPETAVPAPPPARAQLPSFTGADASPQRGQLPSWSGAEAAISAPTHQTTQPVIAPSHRSRASRSRTLAAVLAGMLAALTVAGRKKVEAGDCAQAIPLFRRSQAAYPARGTLLNLADCEADLGRVGSAWIHFNELLGLLEPQDPRVALTQRKLDALKPRVPWLKVDIAPGAPAPTALLLDGTPLDSKRMGVEVPLDPGNHTFSVSWPGAGPTETPVSIAEGAHQAVVLSPPAPAPPPKPVQKPAAAPAPAVAPAPMASAADSSSSNRRTVGFLVGGIGIAGIGVSAVTGLLAMGTQSDLEETCPDQKRCSQEGLDLASKGATLTTTSTVAFVVGVAGLGAGLALVLTAPDAPQSAALAPAVLPGGGGGLLRGRF